MEELRVLAREEPTTALVEVAVLTSGEQTLWLVPPGTGATALRWNDVEAAGEHRILSAALNLLVGELTLERMGKRSKPPIIAVLAGGPPSDDWTAGLAALTQSAWGRRPAYTIRVAVGFGEGWDQQPLKAFVGQERARQHLPAISTGASVEGLIKDLLFTGRGHVLVRRNE